jgi:hypothetical protein
MIGEGADGEIVNDDDKTTLAVITDPCGNRANIVYFVYPVSKSPISDVFCSKVQWHVVQK